jgi:hypothetical protein
VAKPSGDFLSTVSGQLALTDRSARGDAGFSAGVSRLDYYHHHEDSGYDFFVRGNGSLTVNERLSVGASAGFRRDSSFGSVDPNSGLAVNSIIDHQTYSGLLKYALSERIKENVSYGFARDHYQSPGYLDTDSQQLVSELAYDIRRWLPRTTQYTRLILSRDQTDISRVDGITGTLGVGNDLSEPLRFTANVGGRGNWSQFQVVHLPSGVRSTGNDSGAGWVADLSLAYSGVYNSGSVTLVHDLTSASGRSGATERWGGSASASHRFLERLTGSAHASWSLNKADADQFSHTPIDELSRNLGCDLTYEVLQSWSLTASYANTNIDYRLTGQVANQNTFLVSFTWQYPLPHSLVRQEAPAGR